ncbi:DUF305 domain-containing protein [Nocardioides sp. YIM 152588]|uniref:DUF305 domain-containing protein n=1 Tax=Nocardioides sp. YIM 152588 TaxID=3158259 RepID=UPI0032E4BDF9
MVGDGSRRRGLGVLLVGLLLAVAACSGGSSADGAGESGGGGGASATEHNEADVEFATAMIPHHAQALVMVDVLRGRTDDPTLEQLAIDIREAQAAEIEQMVDWLVAWDEEIPATMRDHVNGGHGMGDLDHMGDAMEGLEDDLPGMMDGDDFDALADADVSGFEAMWLTMMIDHHEGAIEMAETELDEGQYRPTRRLASSIVKSQTAEIELMRELLGT